MGIFTEQYKRLQEIKSQGFDPTKELYGERMKGLASGTSMTADKVVALVEELDKFGKESIGATQSYYVKEGDRYKLKSDVVSKSLKNPKKVNVEGKALQNIQKVGEDKYVASYTPSSSGLPEDYYEKGAYSYDALRNKLSSGLSVHDPLSQDIIKQGRANLKYTIENRLSEDVLNRIGITRQQALDIIPKD